MKQLLTSCATWLYDDFFCFACKIAGATETIHRRAISWATTRRLGCGTARWRANSNRVQRFPFLFLTHVIRSNAMRTRWGGVSRGFFFGFAALVVLACVAAVGWNTISAYAKNTRPGSSTAWYATSPPAASNASDRPAVDKTALDNARQNAKAMSTAFHAAAEQVLPAVVTITTRPTVVKASSGLKSAPEEGEDEHGGDSLRFQRLAVWRHVQRPADAEVLQRVSWHAEHPARCFRQRLGRDRRSVRHHSYQQSRCRRRR